MQWLNPLFSNIYKQGVCLAWLLGLVACTSMPPVESNISVQSGRIVSKKLVSTSTGSTSGALDGVGVGIGAGSGSGGSAFGVGLNIDLFRLIGSMRAPSNVYEYGVQLQNASFARVLSQQTNFAVGECISMTTRSQTLAPELARTSAC